MEPNDSKGMIKIEDGIAQSQPRPMVGGHGGIPGKEEEYDSSATVYFNFYLHLPIK